MYSSVAIQSDGKIVVAGSYAANGFSSEFAVARFNADGSLDTTFDSDGKVLVDIHGKDYAESVLIQPDGKTLVAGYDNSGHFVLARLNDNGSLDTTFGGSGKVDTVFGGTVSSSLAHAIALQSDGKIVVAGEALVSGYYDFAVARFNADGSLDTTFDSDGKLTTSIYSSGTEVAHSVAIQSDGKIVVAGVSGSGQFAVVRYNANGSLDTTFDSDGIVSTPVGTGVGTGYSLAIQPDGKIVVAGDTYNGTQDFAVVRYNANGSLDTTFDGDGKVTTNIGSSTSDYGRSVAIQPDGKIVVAGDTYNPDRDFAVVRYNANGSLDTTFDSDGKVISGIGTGDDSVWSMAIQSDGKMVVAGDTSGTLSGFAVVRYDASHMSYTEGNGAKVIEGAITLTDVDDTYMESAMVRITGNFRIGEDVLGIAAGYTMPPEVSLAVREDTLTLTRHATSLLLGHPAACHVHEHQRGPDHGEPHRDLDGVRRHRTISRAQTSTITVTGMNDSPVAGMNDSYSTDEDAALTVAGPGVLANDTDADGDTLTRRHRHRPTHGTRDPERRRLVPYTPAANFHGADSFTYKANDGHDESSDTATVIDHRERGQRRAGGG